MIRFACPSCGMQLSAPEDCAGRVSTCRCGQQLRVPQASGKSPGPPPLPKPTQDKRQSARVSTATRARAPSETRSYRKVIVAAIAATFVVGFLLGCCAASVIFWMFPRAQGTLPEVVKGVVDKATGKPKDDMTFQELEDRLNAAGLKVSRLASRFGRSHSAMWFGENFDGETKFLVQNSEDLPQARSNYFRDGLFLVSEFPDSKQASDQAARIVDIQQRYVFAWGPFLFEGKREVLDNVKAALSK